MGISSINYKRKELIDEVLNDLKSLKNDSSLNQYAINENIAFFEATKSFLDILSGS